MSIVKYLLRFVVFIFLTVLTQVGGVIYLLSFFTYAFIDKKVSGKIYRVGCRFVSFLLMYIVATFLLVPLLAKPFGRVPLPLTTSQHVRPHMFLTCLLNRHYVRPELKQIAFEVGEQMHLKHPGTIINYLDANFPFFNKFPLIPHLSHNDGKKLDLSFCYMDFKTGLPTNEVPSVIGYGINEEPKGNEDNTAVICEAKGKWQYNFLSKIVPQGNKSKFTFDAERTKDLVNFFALNTGIGKIFIEPHLKARLRLTSDKVRFHGCQAVRHDDHIHVQLY